MIDEPWREFVEVVADGFTSSHPHTQDSHCDLCAVNLDGGERHKPDCMMIRAKAFLYDDPLSPYVHLDRISLEDGISAITQNLEEKVKAFRVQVGAYYEVHVTSLRLRTFAVKGTKCYICGAQATHFSIDRQRQKSELELPHMNLWGINKDGSELLFTHDHVLSRGQGGADRIENAEPCCSTCNFEKSKTERPRR